MSTLKQGEGQRIAVIGGGLIGCLTALYLYRLGAKPFILEKGSTGRESSWAGAGILCPIHPWLYPDSFTRLVDASLALYPAMNEMLQSLTGMSIEWRKSGLLIPLFIDDHMDHKADALAWSKRFNWAIEELDAAQSKQHEATISEQVSGALLWPEVGQVRNPRLLAAVRQALHVCDIPIREHAEVVALGEDSQGSINAVMLANGEAIQADTVLLAAGSWSGELAKQIGLALPVEPVKGQIVLLKDRPGRIKHIIKHDDVYLVPRSDGHILVGASMERVGFRQGTTTAVINALLDAAYRIAPGLKSAQVVNQWMGFRPGSPDGMPYLGPVEGRKGLWVASGHYRNGVALAPGTADLMSRWMMGDKPEIDVSDFSIDRPAIARSRIGLPAAS